MNPGWPMALVWLARTSLGGGAILLAARLVLARVRQPARRQAVGQWGLAAALLTAVLCVFPSWLPLPSMAFRQWGSTPAAKQTAAKSPNRLPAATLPDEAPALSVVRAASADRSASLGAGRVRLAVEPGVSAPSAPPSAPATRQRMAIDWRMIGSRLFLFVGCLYAFGAISCLCRWLIGYVALWRVTRSAVTVPSLVAALFNDMTSRRQRRPRLLVCTRAHVPFSFGVLRPTVVLPPRLAGSDNVGPLRCVFAHELMHLERRDAWISLLFAAGQVVYFYLPWLWWLRRQVRLCQEYIADAAAVKQAVCPADYAQFLLGLTTAHSAPAGAAGVSGNSSDLFRRIDMLLQSPARIEGRCPRLWSMGVGLTFVLVAVLVGGLGRAVQAAPPTNQETANVFEAADDPTAPLESDQDNDALHARPDNRDRSAAIEALHKALANMPQGEGRRQIERVLKDLEQQEGRSAAAPRVRVFGSEWSEGGQPLTMYAVGVPGEQTPGRLGVVVSTPSAALAEQLDLSKGQGAVIESVADGSAAAKAGLKANDILLELNGKPVPSDVSELARLIHRLKAGKAIDAVVLRRGKRETISDIVLPEASARLNATRSRAGLPSAGSGFGVPGGAATGTVNPTAPAGIMPVPPVPPVPAIAGIAPVAPSAPAAGTPAAPEAPAAPPMLNGVGHGVMISMFRSDDRFTGRHQEGSLVITVTGTVENGAATVKSIHVHDGDLNKKYSSLDKVPEDYRDKARNLIESAEKNASKVDVHTP